MTPKEIRFGTGGRLFFRIGLSGLMALSACLFDGISAPRALAATVSSGVSVQRFEAEQAELMGGVEISHAAKGFTGTGYVTGFTPAHKGAARVIFSVNVPTAGNYPVALRYANGKKTTGTLTEYINGLRDHQARLKPTGGWNTWREFKAMLPLRAGLNTIWYEYDNHDKGNVNLDSLTVRGATNSTTGATLPYVEYEAENGETNGTIIGPGRDYYTVAAESSGRKAVQLDKTGQYVQITLTQPANAIDVRYAIPDSTDGTGLTTKLGLYINGKKTNDLSLTSKYTWVYGSYPWTNHPSDGNAHHFYDEVHMLLGRELPAGTTVTLQREAGDMAKYEVIDLIDMEQAPAPYKKPHNFLSVTQFGAVPNSGQDASQAFEDAITTAEVDGKGVWIPAGKFNIDSVRIAVSGDVTIRGAGPWYSVLTGTNAGFEGAGGTFGFYDFSIDGNTNHRDDNAPDNGFDDNLGSDSVIQNVWVEHKKCGAWINWPTNHLYIVGCRIRDTMADGVNFAGGTANSTVEESELRNTGDDSLAIWSSTYKTTLPSRNNTFRENTVELPWLANGIAVYGGANSNIEDNTVTDTMGFGGGINISTNFPMDPFSGTVLVQGNVLTRAGGYEYNGQEPFGAIWLSAIKQDIKAHVIIRNNIINNSTYQGIEIRGPYAVTNLTVDHLTVNGAGTYGIEVRDGATGKATWSNVAVNSAVNGGFDNSSAPEFKVMRGKGNVGW